MGQVWLTEQVCCWTAGPLNVFACRSALFPGYTSISADLYLKLLDDACSCLEQADAPFSPDLQIRTFQDIPCLNQHCRSAEGSSRLCVVSQLMLVDPDKAANCPALVTNGHAAFVPAVFWASEYMCP